MTDPHVHDDAADWHDPYAAEVGARLRASYSALPAASDAQVQRVVAAVRVATPGAPREHATPRPLAVQPRWWWGAAAAAVLTVAVLRPWSPEGAPSRADSAVATAMSAASALPSGRTTQESGDTVRFEFTLPAGARDVALVGDFNGWDADATPMTRAGRSWSAEIPLAPGRHEYAFVVDGRTWVIDPLAPQVADAGFGPTNAVVVNGGVAP